MAINAAVLPVIDFPGEGHIIVPFSAVSNWITANSAPEVLSASLTRYDTLLASEPATGITPITMPPGATSLAICALYNPASSQTTTGPPTVTVMGIDGAGVPMYLQDSAGATSWSLAAATSTDPAASTTQSYTKPIIVDAMGCTTVLVLISVASTGTAWTNAHGGRILAKAF